MNGNEFDAWMYEHKVTNKLFAKLYGCCPNRVQTLRSYKDRAVPPSVALVCLWHNTPDDMQKTIRETYGKNIEI